MKRRVMNVVIVLTILASIFSYASDLLTVKAVDVSVGKISLEDTIPDSSVVCTLTSEDIFIEQKEFNMTFEYYVRESLNKYTYCKFEQEIYTAQDGVSPTSLVNLTASCDLTNQRCLSEYTRTDSLGVSTESYYEDKYNVIFASKISDEEWKEVDLVTKGLNFELAAFDTVGAMYDFVFSGFDIPYGVKGEVIDDFVYFEYTTDAMPEDLSSVRYTGLNEKTITLAYKIDEFGYTPSILKMEVGFDVDDVSYVSTTIVNFLEFDNSVLASPLEV